LEVLGGDMGFYGTKEAQRGVATVIGVAVFFSLLLRFFGCVLSK